MNLQRTLYNPLCSLLLCDRHLPPHSKPVYGTVVLPVAPLSTNLDSRTFFFFSRVQKRALESTEFAYRKERTSRQTGLISFRLLIASFFYSTFTFFSDICYPQLVIQTKHCSKRPRTLKICALIKIK